jgi:Ca2+-transporting ATPase
MKSSPHEPSTKESPPAVVPRPQTSRGHEWHTEPIESVVALLETDVSSGLTAFQAEERLRDYGPNELTPKAARPRWKTFLLQFHQPLVYILLVAGLASGLLDEWVDAGVIWAVVLANAIVGFLQESQAAKAIDALARAMKTEATVVRDGAKRRIQAACLVPGDVVMLASGDQVPADLRLISVRDLRVAEAALTGESLPVEKDADSVPLDTPLADRRSLAFASSLVTFGTAMGVVVETGDRTEVGRISELIQSVTEVATPLTREIERFSKWLLYVILAVAGLAVIAGFARGGAIADMFHAAVALAVAAIPEGLPAAVTIVLALGVERMARRHVIIRSLPAVETLGSTSVICSDKTGTLTENEMTVQRIQAGGRWFRVAGVGYTPQGDIASEDGLGTNDALRECLVAGVLCNDSVLIREGGEGGEKPGRWKIQGDPTEGALVVVARKSGLAPDDLAARFPRLDAVPFESEFQYMATLHERRPAGERVVYVKGSVEKVLERCHEVDRDAILRSAAELGAAGLRVLALARKDMPPSATSLGHADVANGLIFLGLQGMIDPPRPEAVAAVDSCRRAGIGVKMITGDHAATAAAVAGQIGVGGAHVSGGALAVITGRELATLSDAGLEDAAERVAVFARVSPEQKLRLVQALQRRGRVVAMTGDGVNDAPALKQADIGVAMGITGTDVAKNAAAMVLTDDNFASIAAAVEEGRAVFDNLSKFLAWSLPTNLGEGLTILVAMLAGVTLPILPVQILWVNLTTGVMLGMVLTFEPKEPDLMDQPPRDPSRSFLTARLLVRVALVGLIMLVGAFGLFERELAVGQSPAYARTVVVCAFVMIEVFCLFSSRSHRRAIWQMSPFSNLWLIAGVTAMLALQLLFTYAPPMNAVFHSVPISLRSWAAVLAVALSAMAAVEVEKGIGRRR